MEALNKISPYPLNNEDLRWVYVNQSKWNNAIIPNNSSYIFVDGDVAEILTQANIELEWSRFLPDVQSATILTINGLTPKQIIKQGGTYETLAQIITGSIGSRRGPADSYHANDWTRNAFDSNATKHTQENSPVIDDGVFSADDLRTHIDLLKHMSMYEFDLPEPNSRWNVIKPDTTPDELSTIVCEFEQAVNEIIPDTTPWYKTTPFRIVLGFTALMILILTQL